ncbi:hypothetical protein OAO75_03105 [Candidatus Pelagibacter ubique]|nr:hypothetical protein [Candidatus Pelagibacter ubique]
MIIENLVIGSGFSSLGAIFGLMKKKKKFSLITGKIEKNDNEKNVITLQSRNFEKYKNNISQAIKKNTLNTNIKNNFVSYLGFGGLSNLWGKIFNTDFEDTYSLKEELIEKLNIKNFNKFEEYKKIHLYKAIEQNIDIKKIIYDLKKKNNFETINATIIKIKFNRLKNNFELLTQNNKIITAKNIYLACGIFSTIKLLKSLDEKKFLDKKIQLNHSNMCYCIFFSLKSSLKKIITDEFIYLSKDKKKFAGRILILNKKMIRKYNLGMIAYVLLNITNFFRIRIFLCSVLYKRQEKSSTIHFKKNAIKIQAKQTYKDFLILNKFKNIFKDIFNAQIFIFKKTLVGSDFHYTSDILKIYNKKKINSYYKNLFILDSSYSKKSLYFPTFKMIHDSYYRVINNLSVFKLLN